MITREQAIALSKTEFWRAMSLPAIAEFQLFTECLCMPFGTFTEAMEYTLGRPIWTHEYAEVDRLKQELLMLRDPLPDVRVLLPRDAYEKVFGVR